MNDTPIDPKLLQLLQKGEYDTARQWLHQNHFSNWRRQIQSRFPFFRENEIEDSWRKVFSVFRKALQEQSLVLSENNVIGIEGSLPVHLSNMVKRQIGKQYKKVSEDSEDYRVIYAIQEHQDAYMAEIYHHFRALFVGYANRHYPAMRQEVIQDIFQDALIVIIEYVKKEKLRLVETEEGSIIVGLNSDTAIRTLLIAIGRRMLAKVSNKKKESLLDPVDFLEPEYEAGDEENLEQREELASAILKVIKHFKFEEKQLLFYKYWLTLSADEMKVLMKADTAVAIRTRLSRLRAKIRNLIKR